ncbi:Biotin and thiamin synthesis associated [uncultured delta proteobacterium]|uniref:Biotin and thiamin synthesis associated n=1 Tax=uncultured delta proteobacterium TaxID=34034 RepID=A0A212JAZ6_9DELT|nr:Biotin and thiamin synthesis associated [uncultured delta proteobacterium]
MNTAYRPFIDEEQIWSLIEREANPAPARIDAVLAKAREGKGLDLGEAAALLAPMPEDRLDALYGTALELKDAIYGNRMVLFAPLYVTNECANRCAYCAFSVTNKDLERHSLSPEELAAEVALIQKMGHKRIMAVYGEHPRWDARAIADSVAAIYAVKTPPSGEIRRVNVNCAPLDTAGFATLKQAGIGTYQCFQETYHRKTYETVHLGGRKKDYDWRVFAMHRAQEAGVDDVGLGVLFGLFDHRFEVLALLRHAQVLEDLYGAGPHTISFPRIEPAQNSVLSHNPPNVIADAVFKRIIAVVRLALPYTGMIITTREKPDLKRELLYLGISQLSAASRTSPGGYADAAANRPGAQQFWVGDERSLSDIIRDLQSCGFVPSFCTSCYRKGRTGEHFMGLAKSAFIRNFCQPNALATYYEYLLDYAEPDLLQAGKIAIARAVDGTPDAAVRDALRERLRRVDTGERDICV